MKSNTVIRTVIALLLCLLLPLQAGATLARATAMALHSSAGTPMTVKPAEAGPDGQALAHAGHHGHRAPAAQDRADALAHDGANHHGAAAKAQPGKDTSATHRSVHAKAGCIDCAKCCLLATSAPPPTITHDFAPLVARAAFLAHSAPVPAFLTDGPERPPRHPIA